MGRHLHAMTQILVMLSTASAGAAPPGAGGDGEGIYERAQAEQLYTEALDDMERGEYAAACARLERVVALAPRGVGARLTLGDCYERAGRLVSAYWTFREAEALAGATLRREEAEEAWARVLSLEARLSWFKVVVPPSVRGLRGLQIACDGSPVDAAAWGASLPIEPGEHRLVALSEDGSRWEGSFSASPRPEADPLDVVIPTDMALRTSLPARIERPSPPAARVMRSQPEEPGRRFTTQELLGLSAGGVGVSALLVGAISGAVAIGKYNESNAGGHCDVTDRCDAEGIALRGVSRDAGDVATAAVVIGGLATAAGAVLFFTAPRGAVRAAITVGPRGLGVSGAF